MSPEIIEAIALEITKIKMAKKSDADFLYEEDDASNWVLTYSLALKDVEEAASEINWEN
ncbi:MAG: hypothetical protein RSD94_04445 [Acinetobacter sp.]|jgi:hypothetical protein